MSQINKPSEYFNTVLYTGNTTVRSITGVGFQPDLVVIKDRDTVIAHYYFDVVRGVYNKIHSNLTNAETSDSNTLTSFDSDGFSLGVDGAVNGSGKNVVSWNWKAGGTASSNTDGTITSQVSVNTTSGFSIVSYTGNGTGSATFGHGLGVKPKIVIIKNRSAAEGWGYWQDTTNNGTADIRMQLNATAANYNNLFVTFNTDTITLPSASDPSWNGSGNSLIAYCFAEKKGFSKFGSFTGNGSTDGSMIYTGFKPAFVIVKESSGTSNWLMFDNKRDISNGVDAYVKANASDAENSGTDYMDFLSNGFKCRTTQTFFNESGSTYIYMAFAENPLVGTNNIPATAR